MECFCRSALLKLDIVHSVLVQLKCDFYVEARGFEKGSVKWLILQTNAFAVQVTQEEKSWQDL